MKHFKNLVGSVAAVLAVGAGAASAADLPQRSAPPPVLAAAPFSWSGFYIGVNLGGAFGGGQRSGYQPFVKNTRNSLSLEGGSWNAGGSRKGLVVGGQLGYNWQISPLFVLGFETDLQYSRMRAHEVSGASYFSNYWGRPSTAFVGTGASVNWFGTARARVGITPFSPNFMIYGTGGLAYGRVGTSIDYWRSDNVPPAFLIAGSATSSAMRTGWTAGVGAEWSGFLSPNISLKAEWLYVDLGKTTNTNLHSLSNRSGLLAATVNTTRHDFHTVRAGLNYRFNWGGAPVVARY